MVTRRPPPPTPEQREAARVERHRTWIASLSDRDWERIRALAREVTPNYTPARLDDLEAKGIAVGVCRVGEEGRTSGERIGEIAVRGDWKVAVLVWRVG